MGFIPTEEHLRPPAKYIDSDGEYNLKILSVEAIIGSKGTPGYNIKFACTESGQICNNSLWETEKAFWRICLFAKACSIQIFKGQELTIDHTWIGQTLDCQIKIGEPNDKGDQYPEIVEFGPGKFESLFKEGKAPVNSRAVPAQSNIALDQEGDASPW